MYQTLFLIGNGFDKVHGLPTGYNDFRDYVEERDYQSVYDFGAGKLCMFTSSGSVDNIHVLDFQRNCIITGSLSNLYDMGTNSFTTVNMNGTSFSGFDYGTTSYFSGNVNGNVVMIYDGKNSSYNTYSLV